LILETRNIEQHFGKDIKLLFPDIKLNENQNLLILGNSGCGKTTLLNHIAGLLKPSKGEVLFNNQDIYKKSPKEIDQWRGENIGIIFQKLQLIKSLNVIDNLLVANYLSGKKQNKSQAALLLERLGIAEKTNQNIFNLSQGQQQRVAIARALMNQPKLLIADEPTSSLDDNNCEIVIKLLLEEASNNQSSLIITTHDQRIKNYFENRINIVSQ
jgi:lipoprotein-releasing system ATP-binding protein